MWILGGFDGNTNVWSDVVSATVQPDGTVSTWAPAGQLPGPLSHFTATLLDGYVYLTGGLSGSAEANAPSLATSWRRRIQQDGTLGGWQAMPDLPVALATHAAFFYGGYLYVCGGINNSATNYIDDRCWRSPVGTDHFLGAFEQVASLLIARSHVHQMPVFGSNVYSVAGAIDSSLDSTTEIDIGTFSAVAGSQQSKPRAETGKAFNPRTGVVCHGKIKKLRLAE